MTEPTVVQDELFPEIAGENATFVGVDDVNRAMEFIQRKKDELAQVKSDYAVVMASYAQAHQRQCEGLERGIRWLTEKIHDFMVATNRKSVKLPAGKAYYRKQSIVTWPEDDALSTWCTQHPEFLREKSTTSPDKPKIKAHIAAGGEPPPGYAVREETRLHVVAEVAEVPADNPTPVVEPEPANAVPADLVDL